MPETILLLLGSLSLGGCVALGLGPAHQTLYRFNAHTQHDLESRMIAVGMDARRLPLCFLVWRLAILAIFFVVWFGLGMPPVAILLAFLVHQLVPIALNLSIAARLRKIREQTVIAARLVATQVRAGVSLEMALTAAGSETPDPFGWQLRKTANQLTQGRGIRQVLTDLGIRLQIDAVNLLVTALQVAHERGGKLADVLERMSRSLEDLDRVHRKRETDTAAGRLTVFLLAVFPLVFLGLFYALDSNMTGALFVTTIGQLVLGVVGFLVYVSLRWAGRILAQVE